MNKDQIRVLKYIKKHSGLDIDSLESGLSKHHLTKKQTQTILYDLISGDYLESDSIDNIVISDKGKGVLRKELFNPSKRVWQVILILIGASITGIISYIACDCT